LFVRIDRIDRGVLEPERVEQIALRPAGDETEVRNNARNSTPYLNHARLRVKNQTMA
jgi:hypothetical protein